MKLKYTTLAAAAASALALVSTSATAFEFGGYTRVGPGQKSTTGPGQRCFGGLAPGGKGGIGRLGNECDTYGEFALSETMDAGGVKYKALLMTNFFRPGSEADGINTKVNQIYVEGTGFDIAPNQTFWVGRRFYGRADVHFDDTFFVNMSGTGAGVDGINPGIGSIGLALFRTGDNTNANEGGNPNANPGTRFNVDWGKIDVNPGGSLRVTGTLTRFGGTGGENGQAISLQHVQTLVAGAGPKDPPAFANTLWVQFGKGSAGIDMGFGGASASSDNKSWRIADSLAWLKGPLTYQTLIEFGQDKTSDTKFKYLSLAGRAAYALTTNFKIQAEAGYSRGKADGGDSLNVSKFTIAPTLTVGQDYYSRPELRFYVSQFNFNDAYRQARTGLDKKSKTTVGFQAEIWF